MISLNFDIPQNFFEEEIRCGYKISKEMKEVWAVELDLLNELIRVCDKYDIKYCVIGGTLLGTIRHEGFIPWDDDIDVTMSRDDYNKLCSISKKEFSNPYFFQNIQSDYGFRPIARLRNTQTTAIQRRENGTKVPYNQGIFIDVFAYDNIPNEMIERKSFINNINSIMKQGDMISSLSIRYGTGGFLGVKGIMKRLIAPIALVLRKLFITYKIPNMFYEKWENEVQKYNNDKTKEIALMYFYTNKEQCVWDSKDFEEIVKKPFEILEVCVPSGYENILTKQYGNWQEFVVGGSCHGEMFFDVNRPYTDYINEKNVIVIPD